ncbi:major facilitator superfamily domain-containing protein [Thelonectria olida]|uniref:Major facilitator superfamily domain-containing protein n=1 Tax=Thelonectria olida TaxID=1576542 RepID=A0A9P8WGP9_9HYPO|nr:major facilitator superfamily domain-containing protein [Thelonectria olida]
MSSGSEHAATAINSISTSDTADDPGSRTREDELATEQTPLLLPPSDSSSSAETPGSGRPLDRQLTVKNAARSSNGTRISPSRLLAMALSLWLLIFLQATNMSGMTLIQGTIALELHTYDNNAMWFSSAFLIPMSSLAPIAGRLATIFPPRLLILCVAGLIAVGSGLCAGAVNFGGFLAGRVVAGVGGAGVLTLAVIFGLELTTERTRGIAMGCINAGFTIGVSFGAIVFGGLMPVVGWRPLFWAQVPCALITGLGVYLSVPSSMGSESSDKGTVKERLARIDYLGASLLTLTIVLFLYSLAVDIQILPLVSSLVTLFLFLTVEYRLATDPIIPIRVLSSRGILFSCLAQLGTMSARWSVLFYSPIFMLAARGDSPATAGSILIPTNLGFALGGLVVGWLHIKRDGAFWLPSVVSLLIFSLSLYLLSFIALPNLPIELFVSAVLLNGLATGAGINYTLAHVLHLSHKSTQYVTTSLIATFRGFGGSFGTAIGGGIFYRLLRSSLVSGFLGLDGGDELSDERRRLISKLAGTPGMVFGGDLNSAEQQVAMDGYAGAARGVWQAAATLGLMMVAAQAATGWVAQSTDDEDEVTMDEDEDRAIATENEGIGEA